MPARDGYEGSTDGRRAFCIAGVSPAGAGCRFCRRTHPCPVRPSLCFCPPDSGNGKQGRSLAAAGAAGSVPTTARSAPASSPEGVHRTPLRRRGLLPAGEGEGKWRGCRFCRESRLHENDIRLGRCEDWRRGHWRQGSMWDVVVSPDKNGQRRPGVWGSDQRHVHVMEVRWVTCCSMARGVVGRSE